MSWSARNVLLASLGIAVFSWLLYLPSTKNEFVWDDIILIGNPEISTLDAATVKRLFTTNFWDVSDATSGMYRPLTSLSFYTDYQLYGNNPAGFHQTNMLLNAAVCSMVFLLLLEMFSQPLTALFAALLFAVFPMHVQSVAWISGRTDVIATLFALLSLWFYVRWRMNGRVAAALGSLGCYVLALLGKEVAIVLPAVILVYELLPPTDARPRLTNVRWLALLGMGGITVLYFVVRHSLFSAAVGALPRVTHGFAEAAALSFSIVAHYAYKLIFPFRIDPVADFAPPTQFFNRDTLVGVAVVALVVACIMRWRKNSALIFGVAVIGLGLIPVLQIVPGNTVLSEHLLYFPSFGFALVVGLAVSACIKRWRPATMATFCVLLLACSARTVMGTLIWKNDFILFQRAVAMSPESPIAHFDFGVSLGLRERYEEALAEFRRATEISPAYADAWSVMGRTEDKLGRRALAIQHCARAVEIDPTDARLVNDLGMMQAQAQDYAAAARSFRRVLELRPRHTYARFNLGIALYQQRDFEGAAREFEALPGKDEDFPNAWFFLAECQRLMGNTRDAANAATHFLSVHTEDDAMAAQARKIVSGAE
jgi:Flp pilus assembly protein TadD